MPKAEIGFTLIEVLVALTVVALLTSSVAVVGFRNSSSLDLQRTTNALRGFLADARDRSIESGVDQVISIQSRSLSVAQSGPVLQLKENQSLSLKTGSVESRPQIVMFPDGSVSAPDMLLSQGSEKMAISISTLTGAVAVQPFKD